MRKLYTLGLAFAAVFAFSAIAVASASALEWLLNGNPLAAPAQAETSGLVLLTDTSSGTTVDCTGVFDGTVGLGALDEITKVLNSAKTEEITEAKPLTCTVTKNGSCLFATTAQVNPINLPWKTELLTVGAETRDDLVNGGKGEPGYMVVCDGVLVTCEGKTSAKVSNARTGVLGVFDANAERGTCSDGGQGVTEGEGTTIEPGGGLLSVS